MYLVGMHPAATWRMPLNSTCAAAMRPVVKLRHVFVVVIVVVVVVVVVVVASVNDIAVVGGARAKPSQSTYCQYHRFFCPETSRQLAAKVTVRHYTVITFRVSRRRREMYCGHARVCVSVCPRLHAYTIARARM